MTLIFQEHTLAKLAVHRFSHFGAMSLSIVNASAVVVPSGRVVFQILIFCVFLFWNYKSTRDRRNASNTDSDTDT